MNRYWLQDWVDSQLASGKHCFSLDQLRMEHPDHTEKSIRRALETLINKSHLVSILKGFYLILTPQYRKKGMLPISLFLDPLMRHLGRNYYLGLLNAALYHGASHQQAQENFVFTHLPAMRKTSKNGMVIHYITIKKIPTYLLEKKKTEAGYISISNKALTAVNLIQFEKRIGGLDRASTVVNELLEEMKPTDFNQRLIEYSQTRDLQRLGYIIEYLCQHEPLADALFRATKGLLLHRIPLKASEQITGFSSDNRWNVVVNTEIQIDE